MNRKSEIEILEKELEKKLLAKEKFLAITTSKANEDISLCLMARITDGRPIITVETCTSRTLFSVKLKDNTHNTSEFKIYHPSDFGSLKFGRKDFELSWFSSSAKESDTQYLFYLEAVGLVAKDMRSNKGVIPTIKKHLIDVIEAEKQRNDVSYELDKLRKEKNEIDADEKIETILASKGIEFGEPHYITPYKSSNGRRLGGRIEVVSISITKVTDKTIELGYIDAEHRIIRTDSRIPRYQALYYLEQTQEEIKKRNKVAELIDKSKVI